MPKIMVPIQCIRCDYKDTDTCPFREKPVQVRMMCLFMVPIYRFNQKLYPLDIPDDQYVTSKELADLLNERYGRPKIS